MVPTYPSAHQTTTPPRYMQHNTRNFHHCSAVGGAMATRAAVVNVLERKPHSRVLIVSPE